MHFAPRSACSSKQTHQRIRFPFPEISLLGISSDRASRIACSRQSLRYRFQLSTSVVHRHCGQRREPDSQSSSAATDSHTRSRSKNGVRAALARFFRDPNGAMEELRMQFTNNGMKRLLLTHIERDVRQFGTTGAGVCPTACVLHENRRSESESSIRCLLNYDDWSVAESPQSTQFLDY